MAPRDYMSITEKIRQNKHQYFLDRLAPYIADGILDTKKLYVLNPRLYEDLYLAYGGIIQCCKKFGLYRSEAAREWAEGTAPRKGAYRRVNYGNA